MAGGVELVGVGVELIPDPTSSTNLVVGTTTISNGNNGRILYNNSGVLGERTVVGAGASLPLIDGILVIASGKTATVNNTLTLAGTDGTVMTFPSTNATIARTDAANSFTGVQTVASTTATPAGGSTSARLLFGTTAGFGVYYGSGAPTVVAAQGSIYLRSDGGGVNDRMYINDDGNDGWTPVVTTA